MAATSPSPISDGASALATPLLTLVGSKLYHTAYGFQLRVRSSTVRVVSACCGQQVVCTGAGEHPRYYCANCSIYAFTVESPLAAEVPVRQAQAYLALLISSHTGLEPLALELAAYDLAAALEALQ